MGENTVQNKAHIPLFQLRDQSLKVGEIAQNGVNLLIVAGVIAVVGVGLKNGVEVDLTTMILNTIGNNKGYSDNNAVINLKGNINL